MRINTDFKLKRLALSERLNYQQLLLCSSYYKP